MTSLYDTEENMMNNHLGQSREVFYFHVCGQINTEKTLELAINRARDLNLEKLVIASETGLSALKAVDILRDSDLELIIVTSAAGTQIEKTVIGNLKIGISDKQIWNRLKTAGAIIIRATDPLYNIAAALEQQGVPTLATYIRKCLGWISSGTAVCVTAVLMATDNGTLTEGEEVVVAAGSWVGLDTALVVRATNSVNLFRSGAMQIKEIVCKPRTPAHSWPVNQEDWVGNLDSYVPFTEK